MNIKEVTSFYASFIISTNIVYISTSTICVSFWGSHSKANEDLNFQKLFYYQEEYSYALVIIFIRSEILGNVVQTITIEMVRVLPMFPNL